MNYSRRDGAGGTRVIGVTELVATLEVIRAAVREHRDQIGDYRCWVDDEVLYHRILPELSGVQPTVPPASEFIRLCESYFNRRQDPCEPPQQIPLDSSVGPLQHDHDSSLDADLAEKSVESLQSEIEDWYRAIRTHREKGHHQRTHEDDKTLYLALPERVSAVTQLPPRDLFLGKNCPAYSAYCQQHPEEFANARWTKND